MMSKKCLGSPKYRERYHVEKRAHLVFGIWPIWYIFPKCGLLYQEKFGNETLGVGSWLINYWLIHFTFRFRGGDFQSSEAFSFLHFLSMISIQGSNQGDRIGPIKKITNVGSPKMGYVCKKRHFASICVNFWRASGDFFTKNTFGHPGRLCLSSRLPT